MRIEFDSSNESELSAVFVAILVLRGGDISIPKLGEQYHDSLAGAESDSAIDNVAAELPAPVAVPLPPVVAPVAATPLPPSPAPLPGAPSAVETDAEGLPWDKRIHSTPPTKTKDGNWRSKRGLDATIKTAVVAELRQAMGAPPPPPPVAEAPPLPPSEPPADASTAFAAPGAAPASEAPPPPAPVAVVPAASTDFATLMRKITGLQSSGGITVQDTMAIAVSLGLTGVRDLIHRPDLIPVFDAALPAVG